MQAMSAMSDQTYLNEFGKVAGESFLALSNSEWAESIQANQYSHALALIEAAADAKQSDLTLRLAWFYCQLIEAKLPVMAVTASLDELVEKLQLEQSMQPVASIVYALAGYRLLERKQERLAIPMFEYALKFSNSHMTVREKVKPTLKEAINVELKRIGLGKQHESYQKDLQAKLRQLETSKQEAIKATTTLPKQQEKLEETELITAKAILEQTEKIAEWDQEPSDNQLKASRTFLPIFIVGVLICILVGTAWYSWQNFLKGEIVAQAYPPLINQTHPVMSLPELQRQQYVAVQDESLYKVQDRLDRLQRERETLSQQVASSQEKVDLGRPQTVEQVPAVVREQKAEVPLLPPPDARKLKGVEVTSLEGGGPRQALGPGLYRGPDGRVYGPAPQGPLGVPGQVALDGSPVRAYEVQRFEPPKRYRTLVRTKVLDAPSVMAQEVEMLEEERPIRVVSEIGHWLELESNQGKRGYIRSQDAVTERE